MPTALRRVEVYIEATNFEKAPVTAVRFASVSLALLGVIGMSACDHAENRESADPQTEDPEDPEPPDPETAATVTVHESLQLRNAQGVYGPLSEQSRETEPLDLSKAWRVPIGAAPLVNVNVGVTLTDGPVRGVPFVFSFEYCPGDAAIHDYTLWVSPTPSLGNPLSASPAAPIRLQTTSAGRALCADRTLAVFFIRGFGGVPGTARVDFGDSAIPPVSTDLSAHGLTGTPAMSYVDAGATWETVGGRSSLQRHYWTTQRPNDARHIVPLVVYRAGTGGLWEATGGGPSTMYLAGKGYTAYAFALDASVLKTP